MRLWVISLFFHCGKPKAEAYIYLPRIWHECNRYFMELGSYITTYIYYYLYNRYITTCIYKTDDLAEKYQRLYGDFLTELCLPTRIVASSLGLLYVFLWRELGCLNLPRPLTTSTAPLRKWAGCGLCLPTSAVATSLCLLWCLWPLTMRTCFPSWLIGFLLLDPNEIVVARTYTLMIITIPSNVTS